MYPGKCGYKSETGGIMKNLRESTSHEKVVDYHKEFYRPENLRIIITGRVDPADLFKVMDDVDEEIAAKVRDSSLPPFARPWQVMETVKSNRLGSTVQGVVWYKLSIRCPYGCYRAPRIIM